MTSDKNNNVLRIGIVGCGRVAQYHARGVCAFAGARLVGVADLNQESARRMAKEYKVEGVYSTLEELLRSTNVDVIHVVTPPAYHYECAKAAIEHGASVLVEKPVAFTSQEVADLYERAAKNNVLVCPDFIQLFHSKMRDAVTAVESGRLGRVVHVDSQMRLDPAVLSTPEMQEGKGVHWSFKLPGGLMHNYITHPLYTALYFTGRLKDLSVSTKSGGTLPQGLTDHFAVQIEGEACTATVLMSLLPKPFAQDVRIFCENGTVYVNFDSQTLLIEAPGSLPRIVNRGLANFFLAGRLTGQATSNILRFVGGKVIPYEGLTTLTALFYESILSGGQPPVSRELAVDVVRAEEMIFERGGKLHVDTQDRPAGEAPASGQERVLVTGAAGYVGSHLVRHLIEAGYYVRALARPTSHIERIESLGIEIFFGDMRSFEDVSRAAAGMDVIVHTAAAVSGRREFMLDTALNGTRNVAEAAMQQAIQRVIYVSSMSVYDYLKLKDGDRITETSPLEEEPEVRGAYTLAKRQAEDVALSHLQDAKPAWTILRPSVVVGSGRDTFGTVGKKMGRILICMAGPKKQLRLVHVEEVASAIIEVLKNKSTEHQIFTLSQPSMELREYVKTVCKRHEGRLHVVYIPYSAAWLGARTLGMLKKLTGKGATIHPRQLTYLYRDVSADASSLVRHTGWEPERQPLRRLVAELAPEAKP